MMKPSKNFWAVGSEIANIIGWLAAALILCLALGFQIALYELPCPLCMLQRLGFFGIMLGFLMNIRFGIRPSHYGIVILSTIFTSLVALRQIALHVVPGTGAYGSPFLGMHLYTWVYVATIVVLALTGLLLSFDKQYIEVEKNKSLNLMKQFIYGFSLLLMIMNIISILAICGIHQCPDDPTRYLYLFS